MKIKKVKSIYNDGDNYRQKVVSRGYLKKNEVNDLMMLCTTVSLLKGLYDETRTMRNENDCSGKTMWDDWVDKGIMTKEQKKNLKMATTYLHKATDSILRENLDAKSKDTIYKRIESNEIRIIDNYMVQKLKDMWAFNKDVQLTREEFEVAAECIHAISCRNCDKNRTDCTIHTFFENKLVPPVEYREAYKSLCNCEYAFNGKPMNEIYKFYSHE